MAVPVVITSVQIQEDGGLHCAGTVSAVATTVVFDAAELLYCTTITQMQTYIAIKLAIARGITVPIASLLTTVNL